MLLTTNQNNSIQRHRQYYIVFESQVKSDKDWFKF